MKNNKSTLSLLAGVGISIAIALLAGFIGSVLGDSSMGFQTLDKPAFAPPPVVFPIVWAILYALMGVSSYIIYMSDDPSKKSALTIYFLQLIVNSLWTYFFFNLEWRLFSFYWILLLILLVVVMIRRFYKISPTAAYLQVPYLLWLCFAAILNLSIYILNR